METQRSSSQRRVGIYFLLLVISIVLGLLFVIQTASVMSAGTTHYSPLPENSLRLKESRILTTTVQLDCFAEDSECDARQFSNMVQTLNPLYIDELSRTVLTLTDALQPLDSWGASNGYTPSINNAVVVDGEQLQAIIALIQKSDAIQNSTVVVSINCDDLFGQSSVSISSGNAESILRRSGGRPRPRRTPRPQGTSTCYREDGSPNQMCPPSGATPLPRPVPTETCADVASCQNIDVGQWSSSQEGAITKPMIHVFQCEQNVAEVSGVLFSNVTGVSAPGLWQNPACDDDMTCIWEQGTVILRVTPVVGAGISSP